MKKTNVMKSEKMHLLCNSVQKMIQEKDYTSAYKKVYESMSQFPNNPEPHNLLGILLENNGKHTLAMKHFRIALILDPTYKPADQNLENFGGSYTCSQYICDDCLKDKKAQFKMVLDNHHIGHVERNK